MLFSVHPLMLALVNVPKPGAPQLGSISFRFQLSATQERRDGGQSDCHHDERSRFRNRVQRNVVETCEVVSVWSVVQKGDDGL